MHIAAVSYLEVQGPEQEAQGVTHSLLEQNASRKRSVPMGKFLQRGHAPSTSADSLSHRWHSWMILGDTMVDIAHPRAYAMTFKARRVKSVA